MSYQGSRNLDANGGIARRYIHKYGDRILLPDHAWIFAVDRMLEIYNKVTRPYRKQCDKIVKRNKSL
jgi:hypothetical protein